MYCFQTNEDGGLERLQLTSPPWPGVRYFPTLLFCLCQSHCKSLHKCRNCRIFKCGHCTVLRNIQNPNEDSWSSWKCTCSKPAEEMHFQRQRSRSLACLGLAQDQVVGGSANRAESKYQAQAALQYHLLPLACWPCAKSISWFNMFPANP